MWVEMVEVVAKVAEISTKLSVYLGNKAMIINSISYHDLPQ